MTRHSVAVLAVLGVLVSASPDRASAGRCPIVVDRTLSYAMGIAVVPADDGSSGAHAFTGAGEVLKAVDVSDPASPILVGRLVLPGTITSIAARGSRLYVWTGTRSLRIIDVRAPESPRQVGWIDLKDLNIQFPVIRLAGRHAFVSSCALFGTPSGVRVIDVGDPTAPVEVARYDGDYLNIAISGDTLYALRPEPEGGWQVDFVDVSDPMDPTALGSHRLPAGGWARDVTADGSFVYVLSGAGLQVIDVSDPAAPIEVGSIDIPTWVWNIEYFNGHVFAHASTHFEIIDVRDPYNPVRSGICETPWTYEFSEMAFSAGRAYISHSYQGIVIVDVSDPSDPSMIGQLVEGSGADVAAAGYYGFQLQEQALPPSSFVRMSITVLRSPNGCTEAGRYETGPRGHAQFTVSGNFAFIIFSSGELAVVDISDPSAPHEINIIETTSGLRDIAIADGYAYLAVDRHGQNCSGLQILDLSDPTRPEVVGGDPHEYFEICDLQGPKSIAVSGSHAFLGAASALVVIDISDPTAPYEVARMATRADAIAIQRPYAYVAAGEHGLLIFDMRVPTAPQLVGTLGLPAAPWGQDQDTAEAISVVGSSVYLGSSRLQVIDISDPTRPRVLWHYSAVPGVYSYDYFHVTAVAATGTTAFLAQRGLGSVILDTSACRQPRRENRRTRPEGH